MKKFSIIYFVIALLWLAILYPRTYAIYPNSAFYFWVTSSVAGFLIFIFTFGRATKHVLQGKSVVVSVIYAILVATILSILVSALIYSVFYDSVYKDAVRQHGERAAYDNDPVLKDVVKTTKDYAAEIILKNILIFIGFTTLYTGIATGIFAYQSHKYKA